MFSGGCVFIDYTSVYVIINYQVDINATETVKAKLAFERDYQNQWVVIKVYHTDNGIFNDSEFMEELLNKEQKIRFSGASALDQNRLVERAIKMVVTMARNMLMYTALICPDYTFSTDLWPTEMDYAVWVYN